MIHPTLAYLDPGSSTGLIQLVAAGLAGVGVMARLFWHRLGFLRVKRDDPDPLR